MSSTLHLIFRPFGLWALYTVILGPSIIACQAINAPGAKQTQICYISHKPAAASSFAYRHDEVDCIDPDTRQTYPLLQGKPNAYFETVSMSPDRKWIAYSVSGADGDKSVWVAGATGARSEKIASGFIQIAFIWLDKSDVLIMGSKDRWQPVDRGEAFVYNIGRRDKKPVMKKGDLTYCIQDGTSVQMNQMAVSENTSLSLGHLEVQDDTLRQAVDLSLNLERLPQPLHASCLSWTSDRQRIVLRWDRTLLSDLFLSRDGGQSFESLTGFEGAYGTVLSSDFLLSPNGQWLALSVGLGGPHRSNTPTGNWIAIVSTENKTIHFVRNTPELSSGFVWSPDKRRVAIAMVPQNSEAGKTGREVYIIDAQNLEQVQLTFDGTDKQVFDWY